MARTRPSDRIERLVACATETFIRSGGYMRTQILDVAKAMGVAKGTVYLYVESKEALFDLVLAHADRPGPIAPPAELPIKTPPAGQTLARLTARISEGSSFPALERALARRRIDDPTAELEEVLGEIYDRLHANRIAIKLVGNSAHDWPELAELWYQSGRERLNEALTEYITERIRRKRFRKLPDPRIAARLITETATWFAVHRHWDPAPHTIAPMTHDEARATVISTLSHGLLL